MHESTRLLASVVGGRAPADVVERVRDLLLFDAADDTVVVTACDSSGSIGPKPHDVLQWTGDAVGRATVKVPLMEVLAAGATPFIVVNTLSVEMEPTGRSILGGIRAVCSLLPQMPVITGSDETNKESFATGVGVTVLGVASRASIRLGSSAAGDTVWVVGLPLGGRDGNTPDGGADTAGVTTVQQLMALPFLHEVLPVGSRGIAYEAGEIARTSGLTLTWEDGPDIDLERSAGASTCVLVTTADGGIVASSDVDGLPVTRLGRLA